MRRRSLTLLYNRLVRGRQETRPGPCRVLRPSRGGRIGEISRYLPALVGLKSKDIDRRFLDDFLRRADLVDFQCPYEPDDSSITVHQNVVYFKRIAVRSLAILHSGLQHFAQRRIVALGL